jgi:hypothetical protein
MWKVAWQAGLLLRTEPRQHADKISHIPCGALVRQLELASPWVRVTYKGQMGWVPIRLGNNVGLEVVTKDDLVSYYSPEREAPLVTNNVRDMQRRQHTQLTLRDAVRSELAASPGGRVAGGRASAAAAPRKRHFKVVWEALPIRAAPTHKSDCLDELGYGSILVEREQLILQLLCGSAFKRSLLRAGLRSRAL